jgi:hypothetical protein
MSEYTEYADTIYTVSDLLSPERCDELIALSEDMGYTDAPITTMAGPVMRPDIRNNRRVILDDYDLADDIWELVRPYSCESFGGCDAVGVNERFRFYRYDVGQLFDWHRDGAFMRNIYEQSMFTLIFYLNDNFEGGSTDFRDDIVRAERGAGLFFHHPHLHRGAPVESGRKYVLRTDIMYRS